MKICCDTKSDIHITTLQARTMLLGPGLPSPKTLLFNCPKRGIIPLVNRPPISTDNDDKHHKALVNRQTEIGKKYDTA